jgi:hypothetical protein
MYTIDEQDRVVELDDIPQHETGAPLPHILASGDHLMLWYVVGPHANEIAVIRFVHSRAHYLGSPNDEALNGHPLYSRGLRFYGVYEVTGSSWIRSLERMNRVHSRHDPRRFDKYRHFVFTFHDDTFECVAEGIEVVARLPGNNVSPECILPQAAKWLTWLTDESRPQPVR